MIILWQIVFVKIFNSESFVRTQFQSKYSSITVYMIMIITTSECMILSILYEYISLYTITIAIHIRIIIQI